MIDTDTAMNLELVGNRTNKKSNHSLFGYASGCDYAVRVVDMKETAF